MLTTNKNRLIAGEITKRSQTFNSDASFARSIGISSAQLSRVKKGEINRVISDENFLRIAGELGFDLRGYDWKTAKTPTYKTIYTQLKACQDDSISAMMIDEAGVGKTHAAKEYVKHNANAVYIDCSQVKTKQLLIREITKKFGVNYKGRYADVYRDLVFYLNTCDNPPLIVLDEAGDLQYAAFLELKALWNATEMQCGYYMMGADGLKSKIERNINNNKIGYTELFRRFGGRFQKSTPSGKEASEKFKKEQLAAVAKANGMQDIQKLYSKTDGSLTRLKIEFLKQKRKATA